MGQRDYIKPLLEAQGTVHFGKVCMKPGKPLTFAEVPREGRYGEMGLVGWGQARWCLGKMVWFAAVPAMLAAAPEVCLGGGGLWHGRRHPQDGHRS